MQVGLHSAVPGSRVWQRTGVVARVCSDVAQVCPGLGWAALRRKAPPAETPPPAIPITSVNTVVKTPVNFLVNIQGFVEGRTVNNRANQKWGKYCENSRGCACADKFTRLTKLE